MSRSEPFRLDETILANYLLNVNSEMASPLDRVCDQY